MSSDSTDHLIPQPIPKPVVAISVREVVEFVLRTGDLGGNGQFSGANRALEGTRGHQRLQRSRPAGYEPEVSITWESDQPRFLFRLRGRIDGVQVTRGRLMIEEIKTTTREWRGPADPLHVAQAKIYAFLYASMNGFAAAEVQVTYLELESGRTVEFRENHLLPELEKFFRHVVEEYLRWLTAYRDWCAVRDDSIRQVAFPFDYRPGQRSLAVAGYRAIRNKEQLFAEAPTGIGKTISVIFPALKAMPEGEVERLFYLTAKTIGRAVAEETLERLRQTGLRLRAVTMTARDKICFNNGQPCDLKTCSYAIGYYDRVKDALWDGLQNEAFTRGEIEALARKHQVCPFELSLDLSVWVDAVICDYNYAFDPTASLKRHFSEEKRRYALLVDEAHNLPDRAREMFSAELDREALLAVRQELQNQLPGCAHAISRLVKQMEALENVEGWTRREGALTSHSAPVQMTRPIQLAMEEAELWLVQDQPAPFRQNLLELYFRLGGFLRTLEWFDERYACILDPGRGVLKLYCLDPSSLLRPVLENSGAAVFFSATLRPVEHFRALLGGTPEDPVMRLDSPFPPENLCVLVQDRIPTRLKARSGSYDAIAASIGALVGGRTGNYLVYFPSYDYLQQVQSRFEHLHPEFSTTAQSMRMSEVEREAFVRSFRAENRETLVGFAVLGGIFGEGIDLVGERLIGVVVVGVGLPQICVERDLIRDYHQKTHGAGFNHAYSYPGMNRVLQAVGRVIRSDEDKGVALLIDERFGQLPYRELLPAWWHPQAVRSPEEIGLRTSAFWDGMGDSVCSETHIAEG